MILSANFSLSITEMLAINRAGHLAPARLKHITKGVGVCQERFKKIAIFASC